MVCVGMMAGSVVAEKDIQQTDKQHVLELQVSIGCQLCHTCRQRGGLLSGHERHTVCFWLPHGPLHLLWQGIQLELTGTTDAQHR
jgi:hypothetical protein